MRGTSIALVFLLFGSIAAAGGAPKIDLDRPGVLDQLRLEHPGRFQAVSAVLRASRRAPCKGDDFEMLKTQFNLRDMECGMIIYTRYPGLRHVSFELDGIRYAATVALETAEAVLPIATIGTDLWDNTR